MHKLSTNRLWDASQKGVGYETYCFWDQAIQYNLVMIASWFDKNIDYSKI